MVMSFSTNELLQRVATLNGANKALEMTTSRGVLESLPETSLRRLIRDAADQLCQVVDGNLDFVVRVSDTDDDIDKLLLLINFVLASARRSFGSLHAAHRRLEEDLAAARALQSKLLPQRLPNAGNLQVATNFVPARAVGGDFFDFLRYEQSGLFIGILADVSGKGAAAAIYAALTSGIVRSLAQEQLNPKEMLERLNKNLFTRAPDGHFVAMTYWAWDDQNLVLEIGSSGLPEPLLCRNGEVQSLAIHGLPLGLFAEAEYETTRLQCEPGDTLLFYTDGLVDAVDPEDNEFGAERVAEIFLHNCQSEAELIVERLVHEVSTHCRCESNFDDQTVIAMKVL